MSFTKFADISRGSNLDIRISHVASGVYVQFPAFITEFSDQFSLSWGSEQVYGRMDPIKPYQSTTRVLSMAFDVVSYSLDNGKDNFFKYNKLIQMLYPAYGDPLSQGGAKGRVLKAPPVLRIKFANLVSNFSGASAEKGLLGCINGLSFNPNREAGFFLENNEIIPKVFNVSFTFEVQHEHSIGWDKNKFLADGYPYGRTRTAEGEQYSQRVGIDDIQRARENKVTGG